MVSGIKPKPLISSLGLAKNSTRLKHKAHTEVKKEEPALLGASSDMSDERLFTRRFRQSVATHGLRRLVDSSDESWTTPASKDANQTPTTVGVRRVLDSGDESPTVTTIKEVKKTSVRKYTRKTKNLGGEKVDQDFKQTTQTKQPPKTATTQKEGVKKTSDAVTSVTGDGPSQRALIPRTKSGEHRLLHPGREPPTQGSIPSPPTAPPMPQRHRRRSSQTTHET